MRSIAEEGTIFWLIASALTLIYTAIAFSYAPNFSQYAIGSAILVAIDLMLASECWKRERGGFLLAAIVSIIAALLSFLLEGPLSTFGVLVILNQLFVLFFSLRAYREILTEPPSKT